MTYAKYEKCRVIDAAKTILGYDLSDQEDRFMRSRGADISEMRWALGRIIDALEYTLKEDTTNTPT